MLGSLLAVSLAVAGAPSAIPAPAPAPPPASAPARAPVAPPTAAVGPIRRSKALGKATKGRLRDGVLLAPTGPGWISWDPVLRVAPGREWRRWGTDRLVAQLQSVLGAYARRHPGATPILVGDLSRPRGGVFDKRFGGLGHASHQNGLDADVYYPRKDRRALPARSPRQVDRRGAQELVDAFVALDPQYVFVGPRVGLKGPAPTVSPLTHHDDHLHVRLRRAR